MNGWTDDKWMNGCKPGELSLVFLRVHLFFLLALQLYLFDGEQWPPFDHLVFVASLVIMVTGF